jgi:hypothetical protein
MAARADDGRAHLDAQAGLARRFRQVALGLRTQVGDQRDLDACLGQLQRRAIG